MPIALWTTLTTGARQLVVHDAAVTMSCRRVVKVVVDPRDDVQRIAALHRRGDVTFTPAAR